ncbi:hypothetical protein MPDQ_005266 [Monascus purpureus]|uniref:Zn(2)-C6 fungal-type domain-containing protein n=1 Tax=Monascus purpureus TaxID=5098 RepID=A0A507QG86_MONPU|nr:hypothetical protein MPDQ_005266 [Monascus purpureus]
MYNSSPERINPPRRKSCDACWMAKRRCDFALPACLRCARRNLPCVYPGQQPAISQEPSSDISLLMEQVDGLSSSIYVGPQGTGNASSGAPTFSTMDPVLDGSDTELVHLISPVFHPAVRDQNNCMAILRTRSSRPVSTIIATRLQFAIDRIKEAPRTTVLENQTPWSHSQLYKDGMPRAMQEDLLSPLPPTTPLEALAHTQALILYQIMYVFDGTIHALASAESLIPALERSALYLRNFIHMPDSDSMESEGSILSTMEPVMDFWSLRVFQESARRTFMFAFYLIQVYNLLQNDRLIQCDGRLGLVSAWYSSTHLWRAQNAFDFAVAWAEKEHLLVYNVDFSQLLQHGQPGDMDSFAKMMLSTSLGIDRAKAWFYSKGAVW